MRGATGRAKSPVSAIPSRCRFVVSGPSLAPGGDGTGGRATQLAKKDPKDLKKRVLLLEARGVAAGSVQGPSSLFKVRWRQMNVT